MNLLWALLAFDTNKNKKIKRIKIFPKIKLQKYLQILPLKYKKEKEIINKS